MGNSCFYLALAFLVSTHTTLSCLATTSTDQNALISFKTAINSDLLGLNWSTASPICSWVGVSCSIKHQRVTALNLSGLDLGGAVPPHIGNLTFLRHLDLSSNKLTGSIPSHLSNLRRLKTINIGGNSFVGEVPPWLGIMPQLEQLYMHTNNFTGGIPGTLFNASSKLQVRSVVEPHEIN